MLKAFSFIFSLVALSLSCGDSFATQTADAEYEAVAEEYIKGYLAAHPLEGTALGLHDYDGKITDYSRLALDAELSRLRAGHVGLRAKSHGLCARSRCECLYQKKFCAA